MPSGAIRWKWRFLQKETRHTKKKLHWSLRCHWVIEVISQFLPQICRPRRVFIENCLSNTSLLWRADAWLNCDAIGVKATPLKISFHQRFSYLLAHVFGSFCHSSSSLDLIFHWFHIAFRSFSFRKCRDSQCFMLRSAALCLADASQLTTLMKADRFKVLPQSIKSLTSPWAKGAKFHHVRFTSVTLESHPRVPSTETCHIISNIPMICHQPKASTKSAGYWRNPALTSSFSMGVRVTPILFKTLQSPLILKAAWWSVAYIAYRPIESVSPKVLERMWFGCLF